MSYKEDLEIDKYALDQEWLRQAILYAKYTEEAVLAEDERDRLKERLSLLETKKIADVRKNPKAYGLSEKPTESAIKEVAALDEEIINLNSQLLDAMKSAKITNIAITAFEHKKRALTKLTDLFMSNYWAQPRDGSIPSRMTEDGFREQARQSLEENNARLRRRK
jgi:hypothetical protein